MNTLELGTALVTHSNAGTEAEFVARYYAPDIVSIEGEGSEEMPARLEAIDAVLGKHGWRVDNHEVHGFTAEGPYLGLREDPFAVRFLVDVTPKGDERRQTEELALYTVRDGRVVQEEFLYRMG